MSPDLIMPLLFPLTWTLWGCYWWLGSRNVKAVERIESRGSRYGHVVPLVVAAALFFVDIRPLPFLSRHVLPWAAWEFWLGYAITAAGLAFAVWARRTIGRNWSGMVTVKQGHELVTTGPYALARHPIYTGILFGFVGSALALDRWRGVLAVVIAFVALWRKLRLEERWMRETFGAQYEAYRRRTRALIPWLL